MIQAYAPTNGVDKQTREDFYKKLQEVAEQIQRCNMVIIAEDMNAKVGNMSLCWFVDIKFKEHLRNNYSRTKNRVFTENSKQVYFVLNLKKLPQI